MQGRPKVSFLGTASGDQRFFNDHVHQAGRVAGFDISTLDLFPMPNVDDVAGYLLEQDVVWVNGGSVANLLAVWEVHDLGPAMRAAWEAGVVLSGVSAGSICWYAGGTTDSFGPEPARGHQRAGPPALRQRRPLRLRGTPPAARPRGSSPTAHCRTPTARTTGSASSTTAPRLVEAVSERDGKGAYVVTRDGDAAVEERIEPRRLRNP